MRVPDGGYVMVCLKMGYTVYTPQKNSHLVGIIWDNDQQDHWVIGYTIFRQTLTFGPSAPIGIPAPGWKEVTLW